MESIDDRHLVEAEAAVIPQACDLVPLTWPPEFDSKNSTTQSLDGRAIERYVHGPREAWGYPARNANGWCYSASGESGAAQQNHNSFYVIAPKEPRAGAPLCVVMHSANRTAFDYLGFMCFERKTSDNGQIREDDDPATCMTNSPDDFYALYLNSTNDEWWGWSYKSNPNFNHPSNVPQPPELRVLDTVEWVISHYHIDRDRVYLTGVSMGGCGALGIGMPNGDIFSAIRVTVPAGSGFASYRMGGFGPLPSVGAPTSDREAWLNRASAIADPPVLLDFSSQEDAWSTTQPALVNAAQGWRLPLVLCWGTFGHTTFGRDIAKAPSGEVALAFPLFEIRKNEAYPVFAHATTDDLCPWLNAPPVYDTAGQLNAYFRWKNLTDTTDCFAMQLWIDHPAIKQPISMPDRAMTDVTFRRLQEFQVVPGQGYSWQISRDERVLASGKVMSDRSNRLTIPHIELTVVPVEISISAE